MAKGNGQAVSAPGGGYVEVAHQLRRWIVGQRLAPGTPLPKQTELAKRFAVSNLTLGRAMRQLQEDGLVVAIRRAGSFVADTPPHLHRVALVFPQNPGSQDHNRFMQALANEAARLSSGTGVTLDCYYGVDDRHDGRDYHRLLADIERHRLAGILFATPPFLIEGTPIVTAPGIPRAAIMTAAHQYPAIAKVTTTEAKFAERAAAWLRDQGRRRLAVLCADIALREWQQTLARLVPQFGFEHRPYWLQAVHLQHSECGRRCLHLMFQPEQGVRPDGLIIADDNLLEAATGGLVDAGIAVPQELSVVAHANFPWPTPAHVPVRRLGYDAGDFLRLLLQAVNDQRRGVPPTPLAQVAPLFDDEYRARHAASGSALGVAEPALSPVHLIP